MGKLTKAAIYVRMSTDDQEGSPEQQREAVEKYAETNGYRITHRFEDLGISGDRTDKRLEFQQMIAAGASREFEAILCWDQDRFGRFDMIEAGRWIYPLRQAGVHLATVTDGRLDWETMAGRLVYSVKQEGKNQYLRDLSKNVSRGMEKLASDGKWCSGVPPFGYVVDADQRLQLGDPADVALVKEIFARYLKGESSRQLSQWLQVAGILSPKGKPWTSTGITSMLKNERYLGFLIYNQRSSSKYKGTDNPQGKMRMKPRDQWTIVHNTHPPMVSRENFDAVQEMIRMNTRKHCPNPGNATALSGLLKCGCCGYGMVADRSNGMPQYTCYSYRERPGSCQRFCVFEKQTLQQVLTVLRTEFFDKYLTPESVEAIKAAMRKRLSGKRADVDVVKAQLRKIEAQLQQATRRLVEVDVDMVRHVQARVRELEDQRDDLTCRIVSASKPADAQVTAVEERIKSAVAWLERLEALVETEYDGQLVNSMLKQFIDKVELQMERTQWGKSGKRFKCTVVGGTVFFKLNAGLSTFGGSTATVGR